MKVNDFVRKIMNLLIIARSRNLLARRFPSLQEIIYFRRLNTALPMSLREARSNPTLPVSLRVNPQRQALFNQKRHLRSFGESSVPKVGPKSSRSLQKTFGTIPAMSLRGAVLWRRSNLTLPVSLRGAALWRRSNPLVCIVIAFAIPFLTACVPSATPSPVIVPLPVASSVTPTLTKLSPTPSATASISPIPTHTPTYRVTLDAVGDIMLARTVGDQILDKGPQIVFAGVQPILDSADIRVGNLECAITSRGQPEHKSFTLQAPVEAAQALSSGGFDVLSLANNHAMDYGYAGLADTESILSQSGIASVGAGLDAAAAHAPVIIERNGLRLAFLAYVDVLPENSGFEPRSWSATETSPGVAWADPAQIKADVNAAKRQADLVIVLLHGGLEITTVINNITDEQRLEARTAIDSGAALVVGSHPHVLQQIERYHGGLIAYSLGNFVFDQYDGIANASVILRVVLSPEGVQSYDYVPVLIEKGLPHVITSEQVPAIGTLVAPKKP
jgi:poly-gamma-glutamate capsule biosynthesis protein CapA/YwtB (metallophosphatase superfamily)